MHYRAYEALYSFLLQNRATMIKISAIAVFAIILAQYPIYQKQNIK
jgi:hypothetical protein